MESPSGQVPWQEALERLSRNDFVSIPHFIDEPTRQQWLKFAQDLYNSGQFRAAQVGRRSEQSEHRNIRGDDICWLPDERPETQSIMAWLKSIAEYLNQRFLLGLVDFETHFARYDSGAHYERHMDNGRDTNRRVISLIVYLNHEWRHQWGGQLVVYNEIPISIDPDPGRGVVFLSNQVEHEVRATTVPRWSLTCWFLRRE